MSEKISLGSEKIFFQEQRRGHVHSMFGHKRNVNLGTREPSVLKTSKEVSNRVLGRGRKVYTSLGGLVDLLLLSPCRRP